MGYYSSFEIHADIFDDDEVLNDVADHLEEISLGYTFYSYQPGVLNSNDHFKWYHHAEDLAELSKLYPGTLFELRATGEDSEMWTVFAKDGKSYTQQVVPVWPEFDESRLSA